MKLWLVVTVLEVDRAVPVVTLRHVCPDGLVQQMETAVTVRVVVPLVATAHRD